MRQLRNPQAERWDFLAGVLPRGINPTDIDLAFEAGNGHFLFIEGKRPGQAIGTGQRLFFDRLKQPKSVAILRIEGEPPDSVTAYGVWGEPMRTGDAESVKTYVRAWFDAMEEKAA